MISIATVYLSHTIRNRAVSNKKLQLHPIAYCIWNLEYCEKYQSKSKTTAKDTFGMLPSIEWSTAHEPPNHPQITNYIRILNSLPFKQWHEEWKKSSATIQPDCWTVLEKSKARFESILSKGVMEVLLLLLLLFWDFEKGVFYFCYFFQILKFVFFKFLTFQFCRLPTFYSAHLQK